MTSGISGSTAKQRSLYNHVQFEYFVAGVTGGAVATATLHPLDLLKIRFAVHDGHNQIRPQYSGILNACHSIVKAEGIKGLYRGVTPNIWGAGLSWGIYFTSFNGIKGWMLDLSNSKNMTESPKSLGPGALMVAGMGAGVFTLLLLNPIWVVKTRLCLQYANLEAIQQNKRYNGMFDALHKLVKQEGLTGMYRGLLPGLFGTTHGAIQFMTYEELKTFYLNYYNLPTDTKFNPGLYILFAATSKLVAVSITYPYQVIRARLQDQLQMYSGAYDVIKKTWRMEGAKGFYKGLFPNILRVTPSTAITFVLYEEISWFLIHLRSK